MTRRVDVETAETTFYDLIIIGGGITGAGVLRDAALRGLKVLLLERDDYASGTSSKSSKLIHGGLRYLKHFDFQMTRESCVERNLLVEQNPHLIEPLPFLFPIYEGDKEGPFLVGLGMWVYEALSSFQNFQRFRMLSARECLELAPDMRADGLKGAAYYFDAWTDDARLVLETIKAGVRAGGLAFNHMGVESLLKDGGQVTGVRARDTLSGAVHSFRGATVLNATGTWVDTIRAMDTGARAGVLSPTKGVHIVVPRSRVRHEPTLAFTTYPDRRLMFSIPWGDVLVIGTTDTHYDGSLDEVTATREDVDYILQATNHVFPGVKLTYEDVMASYAGLRPLVASEDTDDPGAISREHEVFEDPSGLISIAGGKLTTYRLMARQLVDLVVVRMAPERRHRVRACTTEAPITGVILDVSGEIGRLVREARVSEATARHLIHTFGPEAWEVMRLADEVPGGRDLLLPAHGYIAAEVVYAARREAACTLSDVLTRRIRLAIFAPGQGLDVAEVASRHLARELGWGEPERLAQVEDYQRWVALHHRPLL